MLLFVVVELVMRTRSSILQHLRSVEGILRCKGVGRHPEVVVAKRVVPNLLPAFPTRHDIMHNAVTHREETVHALRLVIDTDVFQVNANHSAW